MAPAALVIENGFDREHFRAVHGVAVAAFESGRAGGTLIMNATFAIPRPDGGTVPATLGGVAYGPGLIVTRLDGPYRYGVITGATDRGDGGCDVRLTFALPRDRHGEAPDPSDWEWLHRYSEAGLEADRRCWESVDPSRPVAWQPADRHARLFHGFCAEFL